MSTKERPILMNGEMVRAVLAGKKTQTRRIVKSSHLDLADGGFWGYDTTEQDNATVAMFGDKLGYVTERIKCPFGQPGDRLWVRETWGVFPPEPDAPAADWCIRYRATPDEPIHWRDNGGRFDDDAINGKWRPSIHMPRWACRLTLDITDVRVERVQDITEADATAEGTEAVYMRWWQGFMRRADGTRALAECGGATPPEWMEHPEQLSIDISAVESFRLLWDRINGPGAWDRNDWVWAITFRVVPS